MLRVPVPGLSGSEQAMTRGVESGGRSEQTGPDVVLRGCRKILRTVTSVVTRARMFTAKPDGDVNIFMLQAGLRPCSMAMLEWQCM